jgi:hypothetical protein
MVSTFFKYGARLPFLFLQEQIRDIIIYDVAGGAGGGGGGHVEGAGRGKRDPRAAMMRVLEGRTEAVAGTFNAYGVSNTLWAYATIGQEPGTGIDEGA